MPVQAWQANTYYPPGSFVVPASLGEFADAPVLNGDFELGAASWSTTETLRWVVTDLAAFAGTEAANYRQLAVDGAAVAGVSYYKNATVVDVLPGRRIRARAYVRLGAAESAYTDVLQGYVGIEWLDEYDTVISVSAGNAVSGRNFLTVWTLSDTGNVYAPQGAAKARLVLAANTDENAQTVSFDSASWDFIAVDGPSGLFQAVQANTGRSSSSEPTWPTVEGTTVEDNDVTWELVENALDSVVWEAKPILQSGATEPTWPTTAGDTVLDNTIAWVADTRRVTDERCPNSQVVAIASSKIWAADNDIVAFSATVNPLDWSTPEDAGYLPFGLNTYGATPVAAMGLYRSNLVVFNSKGYQMWQVDEDPANHAILDASPVGCTFPKSVHPVSNDLVFLTESGVRNITIAGASTNLQAGFFGKQIDPLVLDAIASGVVPRALFWPGAGQYWLFFGFEAFVLTMNGGKEDMSWSKYEFPADIDSWTIRDDELILRAGDLIWRVSEDALNDDEDEYGVGTSFEGYLSWPFLDLGSFAREKQMHGFDLAIQGQVEVSVGYNQSDFTMATEGFTIDGDTLSGHVIPLPITAPSFQFRLTFPGDQAEPWEWQATAIYLQDLRSQA